MSSSAMSESRGAMMGIASASQRCHRCGSAQLLQAAQLTTVGRSEAVTGRTGPKSFGARKLHVHAHASLCLADPLVSGRVVDGERERKLVSVFAMVLRLQWDLRLRVGRAEQTPAQSRQSQLDGTDSGQHGPGKLAGWQRLPDLGGVGPETESYRWRGWRRKNTSRDVTLVMGWHSLEEDTTPKEGKLYHQLPQGAEGGEKADISLWV